ncbi:MAG: 3-dehydroquinate synthase [Acidobacteriota bacterium]|jgi:3-dehydroquinate synthase|nr:3-dehydroquinate synthase [Acidobacteriota bacterium]
MEKRSVEIELKGNPHKYEVEVSNDLLNDCGVWAKSIVSQETQKVVLISNQKVFGLYGEEVCKSLENAGFQICKYLMGDGEEYKSFQTLRETLEFFSKNELKRSDAVIALGGGVVGDLAGFAASVYLRGISFLQIPTTLLAMIDSSVGGKTAVNTEFGKNLIGSFYQPNGVLVDIKTLKTLEHRELAAGFCEAIKQGAIGSSKLFEQTSGFLSEYPLKIFSENLADEKFIKNLRDLLVSQINFKAEIVMQDEKESSIRQDAKSRKILNFGHTIAHALERVTDYKYFKHGEAVGYGILVAVEISKRLDICDENSVKSLNNVVGLLGNLPDAQNIGIDKILNSLIYDKKSIGNSIQWILLEAIGKPKIIKSQDIPQSIISESLIKVLKG